MIEKKPTIAIVVSYAHPYIGSGIGNVAQKQAEMLAAEGYPVYLISSNYPDSELEFQHNQVRHVKFPALFFLEKFHIPVPLTLLSFRVYRALWQADIVHVHDGLYLSSFFSAVFAKIFRKKLIATVHISQIKYRSPLINLLQKIAYLTVAQAVFLLSDKLIIINQALYANFAQYKHKMRVIPNGVDTELFQPITPRKKLELQSKLGLAEKKVVLFVGRLVEKKGYQALLQARDPSFELVFVGTGDVPLSARSLKHVHWVGGLSQSELAKYYQVADVLVLPSHGEGYPLCITEAISAGIPVLTTFQHSSLLPLSGQYYFHTSSDSKSLKSGIQKILKRTKRELKSEDRLNYLKQFSWKSNITEVQTLYV